MKLLRDAESFARPLDRAIEEAFPAVLAAATPVHGSEKRVRIALDQKNDLYTFVRKTDELLRSRGFGDLPKLRRGSLFVPHCHQLVVGPWRGIFLVDPSGELVVGLVFSKEPHQFDERLNELIPKYSPTSEVPP